MALIFENIIKDLSQIGFFSKYKFRKRDASFLLKTKGGKYIIEKKIREEMIMTYFTYKMAFLQKKTQHAVYY